MKNIILHNQKPSEILKNTIYKKYAIDSISNHFDISSPHDSYQIKVYNNSFKINAAGKRALCYGLSKILECLEEQKKIPEYKLNPRFKLRLCEAWSPMSNQAYQNIPAYLEHTWHLKLRNSGPFIGIDDIFDDNAAQKVLIRFRNFCFYLLCEGYNGVVLDGMIYLNLLDNLNQGKGIYQKESHYRMRAMKYRELFKNLISIAKDFHLDFFLMSCEYSYTLPILEHLGKFDYDKPELWELLRERYREIIKLYPDIKGFLIKWTDGGDGDNVYYFNKYLTNFTSKNSPINRVKTVKRLLDEISSVVCDESGKILVMRAWDGGNAGIHANLGQQQRVFKDFIDSNLVYESIKHSKCDFHLNAKPNPGTGFFPRQIIEFQHKLEHDGHSTLPLFIGKIFAQRLKTAQEKGITGIWSWPSGGGRRSTNSIPLFKGFEKWVEVNLYVFNRLLWNSQDSVSTLLRQWTQKECGSKKAAEILAQILEMTSEAIFNLYYDNKTKKIDWSPHDFADWHEFFFNKMEYLTKLSASTEEVVSLRELAVNSFYKMTIMWEKIQGEVKPELFTAIKYSLDNALAYAKVLRYANELFLRYYRNENISEIPEKLIEEKSKYENLYGIFVLDELDLLLKAVNEK